MFRMDLTVAVCVGFIIGGGGCAEAKEPGTLWPPLYQDDAPLKRELSIAPNVHWGPSACAYATADELMASCPSQEEIQSIRADFNIYFENGLVENGVLVPWQCTPGGSESSIMLSMYNSFRLMKCIPFEDNFPWAPEHANLYEWVKSLDLTALGYFWAEDGELNHGWDGRVYLKGNELNAPRYRDVIAPSSGTGLIHSVVLIAHEARHAGSNIGHNCGVKDTNLDYGGAWAVQYHLLTLLAEDTGQYFSAYVGVSLSASADRILATRFCNE